MNKNEFRRRFKTEPIDKIRERVLEWESDMLNGNRSKVMLTSFTMYSYASSSRKHQYMSAVHVKGYRAYAHYGDGHMVAAAYSDILKKVVHSGLWSWAFKDIEDSMIDRLWLETSDCLHYGFDKDRNGMSSLDSNQTKNVIIADALNGIASTSLNHHILSGSLDTEYGISDIYSSTGGSDSMLGLVSLIKKIQPEKKQEIFKMLDEHGPASGILGQAFDHAMKFHSY